jgi:hypothetical protein
MECCGLYLSGSGCGPLDGSCECGHEALVFIKCWDIVECLHNM